MTRMAWLVAVRTVGTLERFGPSARGCPSGVSPGF